MKLRRAAIATIAASLLAACVADEAPPEVPVAASARPGGTLRVGIDRPVAVDPANAYEPNSELIARTLCDTLLTTDPVTGELQPGLAESWLVTDGGRQLVIRLRDDALFTDGEPVRARDVVRSLSRAASPELASELADLLRPIAGWDELRGVVETDVARHRRELAGVTAVGEHAVQITLREPQADFVAVLTHPVAAPLSAAAMDADPDGVAEQPVCAGPYVLAAPWSPTADRVQLVRSEHHRPAPGSGTRDGAGWADEIEFRVLSERPQPGPPPVEGRGEDAGDGPDAPPAPEVAAPALRGIDLAWVAPDDWLDVAARPTFELLTADGPGVDLIGLPVPAAGGEDASAVRRALSLAIDREAVAAAVPGRVPATGLLPPTVGPAFRADACPTAPAAGDAAAARRLLDDAGVELTSLRLVTTAEFRNEEVARAVAASWTAALGVPVEVEVVSWVELTQRADAVEGFETPFRTTWSAPVPGADAYLHPLAHSSAIGTTNWSRLSDPEVDEALADDLRAAVDRADLVLEAQRVEDLVCAAMPLAPVVREVRGWAQRIPTVASARADGVVLDRATALPRLRDLYVRG